MGRVWVCTITFSAFQRGRAAVNWGWGSLQTPAAEDTRRIPYSGLSTTKGPVAWVMLAEANSEMVFQEIYQIFSLWLSEVEASNVWREVQEGDQVCTEVYVEDRSWKISWNMDVLGRFGESKADRVLTYLLYGGWDRESRERTPLGTQMESYRVASSICCWPGVPYYDK